MTKFVLIFVMGGIGSLFRYVVSGWAQRIGSGVFPFGTWCVNVVGCLGVGFLVAFLSGRGLVREEYRVALLIGLFGGFTTFSAFGYETFAMMNDGNWAPAVLNVVLNVCLGIAAVWFGYRIAEAWLGV